MNLLIIGAAGRTGRLVVEQGIRRGHTIRALARRPNRIEARADVVEGDATDPEILADAVRDQDAVIMAVGSSAIVRTLLPAMRAGQVGRVIMTSSWSVVATEPAQLLDQAWAQFRSAYADLARAEGMLEGSGLDWSVVRASMLTDEPPRGQVHRDTSINATGGGWQLTRSDYATTLLDVAEDSAMIGRALQVTGPEH